MNYFAFERGWQRGIDGALKLQTDYYVSQGKLGVKKFREGDQKTPIGVYYVNGRIPGPKLPDFYGTGALPINYPNEWDRRNGRGGSGIWLHGTPSDNFSRPPLSSDGCVVLANPDLLVRWQTQAPLNEPDYSTLYTPGAQGYTDYPTLNA